MAYSIIAQTNSTTTLADENGNVITVPSRSILEAGTTFTLVKVNNNTATLEDSNGKVYRDIPCCIDLTQVTGFNVTKVNNNKATLEDGDGNVYAGVPCIVNLTESGGGGSAVIDPLNVTPSTSAQTITASGGVDGYSPVNVSAVDASIDANIVAGNIKNGVEILGVTGNVVELNGETVSVTPTTSSQTITPTSPKNAITEITVNAVTSSIDANIQAGNIKKDVTILGVTGTYEAGGGSGLALEYEISGGDLIHSTTTNSIMDFTGVTKLAQQHILENAYYNNYVISGTVDMSDLVTISGNSACTNMFWNCYGITSVNLSSLTTISAPTGCSNMFFGCSGITGNVDLSSLTTVSGASGCTSMFKNCTGITSANLSSLTTVNATSACSSMFYGCTALTSLSFPSITTTSFGTRVNVFTDMCYGIPNITLHFPSNVQSVIEGLTGYSATAPFGAIAGSVLFDLPATS